MAALAHASIIANGFSLVGLLAAAMIWATQRGRSAYVGAHALQALAYQGLVVLLGVILTLSWGACLAVTLLPLALRPGSSRRKPVSTSPSSAKSRSHTSRLAVSIASRSTR